jgi:putative ABC transport system substrate-binding protein
MHSHRLKRREFITLLGGAAAVCPLAARAQQPERVRRVGALMTFTADDPEGQARMLAFAQELQHLGWIVGRNLRIDIRWGEGDADRNRRYAAELVSLGPDVLLANGGLDLRPLQQATNSVPIVFANAADPWAKVSLRVSHGRAATLLVSPPQPSLVRAENGWSCSRRLRLA